MRRIRTAVVETFALALTFAASDARADQIAVLTFTPSVATTAQSQADTARRATQQAVERTGNALPPTARAYAADVVIPDGTPDTTQEYRAAGRASGSRWTIAGRVEAHGWTYRLELEVCQVETGRVESLTREIDLRQSVPQIAQMIALLVRPQGMGDAPPPWEEQGPPPMLPPPTAKTGSNATATRAAPPTSPSTSTQTQTSTPNLYARSHPLSLGAGAEALVAFSRPASRDSAASLGLTVDAGYALADLPGLELRAGFGGAIVGPQSLRLDVGAGYMVPVGGAGRVYLGPEATFGGFFVLGGDRDPRLWLHGAIPIAYVASEQVQVEFYPGVGFAAGGTGSLGLVGGGARVVGRF